MQTTKPVACRAIGIYFYEELHLQPLYCIVGMLRVLVNDIGFKIRYFEIKKLLINFLVQFNNNFITGLELSSHVNFVS